MSADGSQQAVARIRDTVSVSIPAGTPIAGQLSGQSFTGAWTAPVILHWHDSDGNQALRA